MARVAQQQCHRFHAGAAYSEARARQEKSCGAGLINRRVSRQPGQPLTGASRSPDQLLTRSVTARLDAVTR